MKNNPCSYCWIPRHGGSKGKGLGRMLYCPKCQRDPRHIPLDTYFKMWAWAYRGAKGLSGQPNDVLKAAEIMKEQAK